MNLDQIHATLYQHNKERIEKSAIKPNLIRYAETSMKTGFGLKYIYDYLAVPFLQLQVSIKPFQHVQLFINFLKDGDATQAIGSQGS